MRALRLTCKCRRFSNAAARAARTPSHSRLSRPPEPLAWPLGGALTVAGPAYIAAASDLVYSAHFLASGAGVAAVLCLLPVGVARSASAQTQEALEESQVVGDFVKAALRPVLTGTGPLPLDGLAALATTTKGGDWSTDFVQGKGMRGIASRLVFSAVLPRQDVILEYTCRELQAGAAGNDGQPSPAAAYHVAAGLANGFVASVLVDWSDKVTAGGSLLFTATVLGLLVVDHTAKRAAEAKHDAETALAEVQSQSVAKLQSGADALEDAMKASAEKLESATASARAWSSAMTGDSRVRASGSGGEDDSSSPTSSPSEEKSNN